MGKCFQNLSLKGDPEHNLFFISNIAPSSRDSVQIYDLNINSVIFNQGITVYFKYHFYYNMKNEAKPVKIIFS